MQLATCHTSGCGNEGHAIPLDWIAEGEEVDAVVCGVCGQEITDLVTAP